MLKDPRYGGFWYRFIQIFVAVKKNKDPKNAIPLFVELANRAQEAIYVVAGNLNHEVWEDTKVIQSLDNASKRGVEIKIIIETHKDIQNQGILDLANAGKIQIFDSKKKLITHFTIVDFKDVRVEEPHHPDQPNRAWLRYNSSLLSKPLLNKFYTLLSESIKRESISYVSY